MFPVYLFTLAFCTESTFALSKDVNKVKFQLYKSADVEVPIDIEYGNQTSMKSSGLRNKGKTTFVIDGLMSNGKSKMSMKIKSVVLEKKKDENVIVIDWGELSGNENEGAEGKLMMTYLEAVANVGPVGKRIAQFIQQLKEIHQIAVAEVHLIGHSLGAHISGAAGESLRNDHGDIIGRISGLDPAGPLFTGAATSKRLDKGDASFVDIYHTNRNKLGDQSHNTGTINVYINGGDDQPGCKESATPEICSHSYSWQFFAASFTQDFKACPCEGNECQCSSTTTKCSDCANKDIVVGYNAPLKYASAGYSFRV